MNETPELEPLTALLRRRFRRHNLRAVELALLSLAGAGVAWGAIYFVARWVTLLVATVVAGVDGRLGGLPRSFDRLFLIVAGLLLYAAWLRRMAVRSDLPVDRKSPFHYLVDFLLTPAAMTLAIWGNLSTWQWFSAWEARQAARLLTAILQAGRLPLTSAPVVIPNDDVREQVILGLMLIQEIELQREETGGFLRLTHASERTLKVEGAK